MTTAEAVRKVRTVIGNPKNQCYPAAEAVFHLSDEKLTVHYLRMGRSTHWYLRKKSGAVVDPTVHQFTTIPNYGDGYRCGFLTKMPSARAMYIMKEAVIL